MTASAAAGDARRAWGTFLGTVALVLALWGARRVPGLDRTWVVLVAMTLPLVCGVRSFAVIAEVGLIPCVWAIAAAYVPRGGALWTLPLVAMVVQLAAHQTGSRLAALGAVAVTLLWADLPRLLGAAAWPDGARLLFLGCTAVGTAWFLVAALRGRVPAPRRVDFILCSYTGNTAHYGQAFIDEARRAGAEVAVHRLHHYPGFDPRLDGDALVFAFPVAGWQPFWPAWEYLLFHLPRGHRKPAFLLHSSAGGPENAGVVPWIILSLKGYRVRGRAGAVYPVNVPTIRLGPARLWAFLDGLLPRRGDLALAERAARAFCRGDGGGLPFQLYPSPLFLLAPPVYNRWFNRIYHTYAWKRRCNQCGLCVRFCPVERLAMRDDLPRSKGTCTLCFGCVNLCPAKACHVLFFSEYGQPYRPRWKKLVVKRKPKEGAATDEASPPSP